MSSNSEDPSISRAKAQRLARKIFARNHSSRLVQRILGKNSPGRRAQRILGSKNRNPKIVQALCTYYSNSCRALARPCGRKQDRRKQYRLDVVEVPERAPSLHISATRRGPVEWMSRVCLPNLHEVERHDIGLGRDLSSFWLQSWSYIPSNPFRERDSPSVLGSEALRKNPLKLWLIRGRSPTQASNSINWSRTTGSCTFSSTLSSSWHLFEGAQIGRLL